MLFRIVRRYYRRKRQKNSVASKREYDKYKEQARAIVNAKLEFWWEYYRVNLGIDLSYNRVSIKNSKTRWGSCSSKKNLNFSYKIVFLSEAEKDYLIVHELCHLQEMNHGPNFWALVAKGVSDFEIHKRNLRKWKGVVN